MELTAGHRDALTELINIGYGRAAGALSELTGYRIALEVPQVSIHSIEAMTEQLGRIVRTDVASVHQVFRGPISGNALLVLEERGAAMLSRLLGEQGAPVVDELDASSREIVTEVGNILLNACLGVFGNLLQVPLAFDVPQLHVENVGEVLRIATTLAGQPVRFALMIHTRFIVKSENVSGYLVIVLGISSMDRLLQELQNWEARQVHG